MTLRGRRFAQAPTSASVRNSGIYELGAAWQNSKPPLTYLCGSVDSVRYRAAAASERLLPPGWLAVRMPQMEPEVP